MTAQLSAPPGLVAAGSGTLAVVANGQDGPDTVNGAAATTFAFAAPAAGDGGGWPDASNTGATEPGGGWDTSHSGLWQYFTPDSVIEGVYIVGQIRVRAENVTVRNCVVVGDFENQACIWGFGSEGLGMIVEDCTTVGIESDIPSAAGVVGYLELRRCDISNSADGFKGGDQPGEITEDNYVHHLRLGWINDDEHVQGVNNTHADGGQWQAADGAVVEHNSIDGPLFDGGSPTQPGDVTPSSSVNGGIFFKTDSGDCTGITIRNNRVRGFGNNCYLYATTGRAVDGVVEDNIFGEGTTGGYSQFGAYTEVESGGGTVTMTLDGNVNQDGDPVS